jgi:hypothetical protein
LKIIFIANRLDCFLKIFLSTPGSPFPVLTRCLSIFLTSWVSVITAGYPGIPEGMWLRFDFFADEKKDWQKFLKNLGRDHLKRFGMLWFQL